jgi:acetate kinase
MLILTVNGGSSSIKFALFEAAANPRRMMQGAVQRIGLSDARLIASSPDGLQKVKRAISAPDHSSAVEELMRWLKDNIPFEQLSAVGHRIVHGGPRFFAPQRVTPDLLAELRRLTPFDPQHLPEETHLLEEFTKRLPGVPQIACFDTAFHHDLPIEAQLFAIPRRFFTAGVRRYGFHGLSYTYLLDAFERVAGRAASEARIIMAHLGNGASLAAVRERKPIETSMGFTPTGGVPMSTRSGDLDPGVLAYLTRTEGIGSKQLDHLLNFESGLLGISGKSSDMRDLMQAQATGDVAAAQAIAVFCYHVKKYIGAFAAALGGLNTLIFSGGIGENVPQVRSRICEGLAFLGITLDSEANTKSAPVISAPTSVVTVRVIPTDEELTIARSVCSLLGINNEQERQ